MEERAGGAFAGTEHLTVIGKQLRPGEAAPDFSDTGQVARKRRHPAPGIFGPG